jgi:hypothetical protein
LLFCVVISGGLLNMKIYQHEINDGLEKDLLSNNTIACCALAESYSPSEEDAEKLKRVLALARQGERVRDC